MSSLRSVQALLCLILVLLAVQAWLDPVPLPAHVQAASVPAEPQQQQQPPHHHHVHNQPNDQQQHQANQPTARPRFTQQHEHHRFPPHALRQWQDEALAQMDAMHRLTAPLMHWFGSSSLDPYYRGGRRWPSARAWSSPFSDLWGGWPSLRDPFASLSQWGRDWDSDFFAGNERPSSAITGTDKTGGALQQTRNGGLDAMLTGSSFHVHDKEDAYELEAHVPGFRPEELHVEVQGDRLVLSGEKRSHEHRGGKTATTTDTKEQQAAAPTEPEMEVQQYSYFRKSYALPPELADSTGALASGVANEAVKAAFDPDAHVLRVSVAKPHVLHARRVKPPPAKIEVPLQIQQANTAAPTNAQAADEPKAPSHQHTIPEPDAPPHRHTPQPKDELRR